MSNNPYEVPQGNFDPGGGMGGGGPNLPAIQAKVTPPAIGLIVTGVLNVLFSLWGIVSAALFVAGLNPMAQGQMEQFEELAAQGGEQADMAEMMMQITSAMQGPVGLVTGIIQLVIGAVIIAGAIKMKGLQSYGFALTATILAMIPCLSNCCIIGLPIGIWALVVLLDNNVKQAFR
jgi:hypothetical protein